MARGATSLRSVYFVLASLALKRGCTRAVRLSCFVAAVLLFGIIVGIARAHHPLGWLAPLLSHNGS